MRVVSLLLLLVLSLACVANAQNSVSHSVRNEADGSVTVSATAVASTTIQPNGAAAAADSSAVVPVQGVDPESIQVGSTGGSLQERAYAQAVASLHIREIGGNNRGRDVDAIVRANGGDLGEPWCGDFMAWCYRRAGSRSVTRIWASAYGTKNARGIVRTTSPIRGDLVVFNFSHIGMFVSVQSSSLINTIEGNTGPQAGGGAVRDAPGSGVHRRQRARSLVLYYLRVTA